MFFESLTVYFATRQNIDDAALMRLLNFNKYVTPFVSRVINTGNKSTFTYSVSCLSDQRFDFFSAGA